MRFSLVQSELLRSLQLVAAVVPSKTTAHHLTAVRVEASKDGKLTFTGTDLDTFLVTNLHATVEEPGVVAIPARRFLDVVKELPSDVVQVRSEEKGITLRCGQGRFKLVGPDPQEFPPVPELNEEKVFAIGADVLDRLITQTVYAVSTDFTRAEQTGVYVHVVGGELRFVATNGHRLARASHRMDYTAWGDILVPPKALLLLQRLLSEAQESVSVSTSKRYCLFNLGSNRLYTRLLDGSFPPYEQAIPTDCNKKIRVSRELLTSAIRRVAVFSEDATKMIRVALEDGAVRLSAQTHDVGTAEEPLAAQYDGAPFQIGFNANYLLDLLRTMSVDEVEMAFREATSAGVITPVAANGETDLLCLVMPLRLPDDAPVAAERVAPSQE